MVWSVNCHLIRVWLRKFQSFRKTIAILRSETETGLLNLTRQQQLLPLLQPTKAIIMPISNGGRRGANRLSGDALTRPTAKGFMGGNTNVSIVIMQILCQRGKQSRKELGGKQSWWASFARLLASVPPTIPRSSSGARLLTTRTVLGREAKAWAAATKSSAETSPSGQPLRAHTMWSTTRCSKREIIMARRLMTARIPVKGNLA